MKKEKIKTILITSTITFFCTILLIAIVINVKNNSEVSSLKNTNEVKNKQFAVMLQNESGGYAESESSSWPTTGYELNTTLTNCTDETGTKVENVLRYENGNVAVKSNKKLYCYLYFDSISGLCTSGSKLGSCLIEKNNKINSLDDTAYSGMYRFTGTNDVVTNNYVCFGTTSKEVCLDNSDKYMYRMIGVTSEANDTLGLAANQVKVIKAASIGKYNWHTVRNSDTKWESSAMYTYLQGSSVLGNTSVIPSGWSDKISSVKWNIGDVQTFTNGDTVYGLEDNTQTTNTSKVGLMYSSDYYYAYTAGGTTNCNSTSCTNWLTDTSDALLTMSRYGRFSDGDYYALYVHADGSVKLGWINVAIAVHPVFYLNSDEIFVSGMGTEDDPIMLEKPKETASETIIRKDTENDIGLQQTIITGDDLYRFSGTQGNTGINNYICLGTISKCESGSDNMYRIIGVNPSNGELKVIKETPWNNKTGYAWQSSNTNATWLTSTLYTGTLKGIYDNLSFKDMIVTNHSWNVGTANSASIATRASAIDYENNTTGTANIGILSLTDFYLAYNGDRNWYTNYDLTTNWIGGYLNKNVTKNEWTMTYFGSDTGGYSSWVIRYDLGNSTRVLLTASQVIRPVFYLKSSVNFIGGTGTASDPFLIS